MVAINDFLEFLLAERGASANTLIAYGHDLRQLADFLRERLRLRGEIPWHLVDRTTVHGFSQYLKERGYQDSSVARKLAAVRRFFTFLAVKGVTSCNPAAGLASPRRVKPLRRPPTAAEVERLLEQPLRKGTAESKRDLAMLELICATGMRVGELVSLDVASLQLGPSSSVRCAGTKSKSRTVPIRGPAVAALRIYVEKVRPLLVLDRKEPALFVNRTGERLSRQGFWFNVRKYALAAGLGGGMAPKSLRYSYASHVLGAGVSLQEVQEILGHANISTTREYLSLIRDRESKPALCAR